MSLNAIRVGTEHRTARAGGRERRRVLLVSYDFPPRGGVGALRAAKVARYLPDFEWDPVILTSRRGSGVSRYDPSLGEGLEGVTVKRTRAPSLFMLLRSRGLGKGKGEDGGEEPSKTVMWRQVGPFHPSAWVIPDAKILWLPSALRWAKGVDPASRPEVVISTIPTPAAALVGWSVAKLWGVPHVVDYRDPWSGAPYLPRRPRLLAAVERWLESRMLRGAAAVTAVHHGASPIRRGNGHEMEWVELNPNGFDEADFLAPPPPRDGPWTIAHVGTLFSERGLADLIEAIDVLRRRAPHRLQDARFVQVGLVTSPVQTQLRRLAEYIEVEAVPPVPHSEAVRYMQRADLLYLPSFRDFVPAKAYEYLRTGVPVLAVVRSGTELERILEEVGMETCHVERGEPEIVADYIERVMTLPRRPKAPTPELRSYSFRETARRFARLLDRVTGRDDPGPYESRKGTA